MTHHFWVRIRKALHFESKLSCEVVHRFQFHVCPFNKGGLKLQRRRQNLKIGKHWVSLSELHPFTKSCGNRSGPNNFIYYIYQCKRAKHVRPLRTVMGGFYCAPPGLFTHCDLTHTWKWTIFKIHLIYVTAHCEQEIGGCNKIPRWRATVYVSCSECLI